MRPIAVLAGCFAVAGMNLSANAARAQDEASLPVPDAPSDEADMQAAAKVVQSMIDAGRALAFERWLAHFAPDVTVIIGDLRLEGRSELGKLFKPAFQMRILDPKIVESGWTGDRIYIVQDEYLPDGTYAITSYTEYEVLGGKILTVESYPY